MVQAADWRNHIQLSLAVPSNPFQEVNVVKCCDLRRVLSRTRSLLQILVLDAVIDLGHTLVFQGHGAIA